MKRTLSFLLCAAMLLGAMLGFTSCGREESVGRVYYLNFKPEQDAAWQALAKKYEVDMPIIQEVNAVLFENKSAREAVHGLMMRDKKSEHMALEWDV